MSDSFDIVIVGGGLVGTAFALCLSSSNARIALVDATPENQLFDERYIALSDSSIALLEYCGVWSDLLPHAAPIKQIHVSKKNTFGITRLDSSDFNLNALGYVVPASQIQRALYSKLKTHTQVKVMQPAMVQTIDQDKEKVFLSIQSGEVLTECQASWVIAADGTHSMVRSLLNIPTEKIDYHQSALVTLTQLNRTHTHVAYERFLAQGAIAMLPLPDHFAATVWTDSTPQIQKLMELNDETFLETLQRSFGYRLGLLQKTYKRSMFPLQMTIAKEWRKDRIFLLGNALHTLHPIASQGLNLSLLEVAFMTEYFQKQKSFEGFVPRPHRFNIQLSKHLLSVFSSESWIMNVMRSFGLVGLDLSRPLKKRFLQYAMGRVGQIPTLICRMD